MPNYKDILSGTLRSLGDKVKEVGEAGGVKEIYSRGAERAKSYARAAKLSLAINGETEELRKIYTEIGKLYFEQNAAAPGPLYQGLFAQAEELREKLLALEAELKSMKDIYRPAPGEENADVAAQVDDFESVVNATESQGTGEE